MLVYGTPSDPPTELSPTACCPPCQFWCDCALLLASTSPHSLPPLRSHHHPFCSSDHSVLLPGPALWFRVLESHTKMYRIASLIQKIGHCASYVFAKQLYVHSSCNGHDRRRIFRKRQRKRLQPTVTWEEIKSNRGVVELFAPPRLFHALRICILEAVALRRCQSLKLSLATQSSPKYATSPSCAIRTLGHSCHQSNAIVASNLIVERENVFAS